MGCCTAGVTKRSRAGVALAAPLLVLWSMTAGACVLGSDTHGPILSIDLRWDRSTDPDRFRGGNCESAGVVFVQWTLRTDDGDEIAESEDGGEDCERKYSLGYDFSGLTPGTYELEIHGFDENDEERWSDVCTDLVLSRFDTFYSCNIDQVEAATSDQAEEL